ncbi:MAG TPA: helix-turn-helix transcriptional regulator [Thermoanaerobaculia bacterium]
MKKIHKLLKEELQDPELRTAYAEEFLHSYIALQIKTLRQQRNWSQEELAQRAGMKQSRISAMEQADYDAWSVRTLKRLAEAFDLALLVQFQTYGKFLDNVTAVSRPELERSSFPDDPAFQVSTQQEATASDAIATAAPFRGRPINTGTPLKVASYG